MPSCRVGGEGAEAILFSSAVLKSQLETEMELLLQYPERARRVKFLDRTLSFLCFKSSVKKITDLLCDAMQKLAG